MNDFQTSSMRMYIRNFRFIFLPKENNYTALVRHRNLHFIDRMFFMCGTWLGCPFTILGHIKSWTRRNRDIVYKDLIRANGVLSLICTECRVRGTFLHPFLLFLCCANCFFFSLCSEMFVVFNLKLIGWIFQILLNHFGMRIYILYESSKKRVNT